MDLTPYKNCLAHTRSMFITTNGETKSCCYFKIDLPSKLNWEAHNKLLNDVDIARACKHCIDIESSGTSWSHRKIFEEGRDYVISIFFDSLCNQACVTCFPEISSSLAKEWYDSDFISKIEYDRVRKIPQYGSNKLDLVKDIVSRKPNENIIIEVYGGEPTSSPQLIPMIEWLVEEGHSKRITLSLISNGSRVLKNIEKHLQNFHTIKVSFSIDGINDQFTYLRWPTTFNTLQDNMDVYYKLSKEYNNLFLSYNYTLSWMNSLVFFDFLDWMYGRYDNLGTRNLGAYMTKLVERRYFSVDVLSNETRAILLDKADNYKNPNAQEVIKFYIDYISGRVQNSSKISLHAGIDHMKKLDVVRKTDCTKLFSDIIELENKIGK
jgi:hypothetical protein